MQSAKTERDAIKCLVNSKSKPVAVRVTAPFRVEGGLAIHETSKTPGSFGSQAAEFGVPMAGNTQALPA